MIALLGSGIAVEACLVGMVALGDLRQHVAAFQALFLTAFAAMLVAFFAVRGGQVRHALVLIVACAAVFRITAVVAEPTLSDDIYRYLWEGRVVLDGSNPYLNAPDSPHLAHLRDDLHASINHPEMTSIYPPAAQVVFAASQLLSSRPWSFKLLAALADLGVVAILCGLLAARGRPRELVLVYAWHPLPIVEFAASGHLDVFGV